MDTDETKQSKAEMEQEETPLDILKKNVREDEQRRSYSSGFVNVITGGILYGPFLRSQLWVIILVAMFVIAYIAVRFQCQRDFIKIGEMEEELLDYKYRALASSSVLTEKCRESYILEALKANNDSTLKVSKKPPFIVEIPEKKEMKHKK